MDGTRSDHKARVDSTSNNTTKRVPSPLVKPVKEIIEPMLDHVSGGAVVEPRTKGHEEFRCILFDDDLMFTSLTELTMGRTRE